MPGQVGEKTQGCIEVLDKVVVASGDEPRSRALAGVQLLGNGDLLVGYREGSVHPVGDHEKIDDGAVMTTRSTDGGRTWGEQRAVVALPGWDSAGGRSIVQTPDGHLIMFVFQARRAGRRHPETHVYPTRSTDGGHTWGPFGPELRLSRGWTEPNTVGHIHVLSDGRWMMPAYGADAPGGATYPIVAYSDDGGETWGDRSVIARGPAVTLYEPAIIRLRDGRFMAAIRSQDPPFATYQSYSADEGRTWTPPQPLPFYGQTPFLMELRSGAVMCVYRDRDPVRPGVSASVTHDNGVSWEYAARLYEASDWNCGYPGVVRLPGGRLLCVYYTSYEAGNCEVHGMFLRERD